MMTLGADTVSLVNHNSSNAKTVKKVASMENVAGTQMPTAAVNKYLIQPDEMQKKQLPHDGQDSQLTSEMQRKKEE